MPLSDSLVTPASAVRPIGAGAAPRVDAPAAGDTHVRALADVVVTERLAVRASRAPDFDGEVRAMHSVADAMNASARAALNALMREALALCSPNGNATTGVSLLERDARSGVDVFRWTAMAGRLSHRVGGATPRAFSPCGVCVDQQRPVLFDRPDTHFTYFLESGIPFIEGLVLPFRVDGEIAGTIWIVSHDESWQFDAEDVRIMSSLADFTGTVYALLQRREEGEARIATGSSQQSLTRPWRMPLGILTNLTAHVTDEPSARAAAALAQCAMALSTTGVSAALHLLNRRTRFRFTGLYRAEPTLLRNIALVDRENAMLTLCAGVMPLVPFVLSHAPEGAPRAAYAAGQLIHSYFGAPIRLQAGRVWGTLCHFDQRPRLLDDDERRVLEAAAPLFAHWLTANPAATA